MGYRYERQHRKIQQDPRVRRRTQREKKNWPKGGYSALAALAKELHGEVAHWKQEAADLYNYQKYFIILFYSKHALRGDLADVRIKKPLGPNYLKGNELHIGEHKTARARGAINLKLAEPVQQALKAFLPWLGVARTTAICSARCERATGCGGYA